MILNIISSNKGGGAEILVNELHKLYLAKNLDSHVIYFSGNPKDIGKNQYLLGHNPRNPLVVLKLRKSIKKLLKKSKGELIIHVHLTWPFFYVILAVIGIKNIKLFFTVHGKDKRRKIPLFWIFEKIFYLKYTRIICISDTVLKSLIKWLKLKNQNRVIKIYNGSRIFSLLNRNSTKKSLPSLISVGSLTSTKNFSTTIFAVSRIRDKIKDYIIVGEGPERDKLQKIIDREKLNNKVKLLGWSDNIEKYLHYADIQVIPSKIEGFGLVAVEGMSTGLPIVASNIDSLKELFGNKNISVTLVNEIESEIEWSKKICKAINDLQALGTQKISSSSRYQAEKFSLIRMADNYLDLYNNC